MKPVPRLLSVSIILMTALLLTAGCTQPVAPSTPVKPPVTPTGPVSGIAPSTSADIRDYVDNAVAFAQNTSKSAALAAFNNPTGPFVTGDVYIYAFDYNGTALALPFQPELVGSGFLGKKDASGKAYTDIEVQLARSGGGYLVYHYPVPGGNATETLKMSYVRPVDDTYWIGAGIYTNEDRLVDPGLREFLGEAKQYALANGREKAVAEFNNLNGSFVRDELYIFAYDFNGTVLSWPHRPDQVGVNRLGATDPYGAHHVAAMLAAARNGTGMVDYYSVSPLTNRTELKITLVTDIDGKWFIGSGRYIGPDLRVLGE
jgi:polar amino acid transport system substrate-binding protein